MTLEEAIKRSRYAQRTKMEISEKQREYYENVANWLEELKSLRKNNTADELFLKLGYIKKGKGVYCKEIYGKSKLNAKIEQYIYIANGTSKILYVNGDPKSTTFTREEIKACSKYYEELINERKEDD